jgi:hypothetical protein
MDGLACNLNLPEVIMDTTSLDEGALIAQYQSV